ncbi:anhydro-N-acetylmuramic acid kinase [Actinomycetales bacterium SN12]|nr:anhydro-N-acetylmuramic acid kinase [Actinomycetales bacterium SN12]
MRVCALQSGTSADGVDVLIVDAEISGDTLIVRPGHADTIAWDDELRRQILAAADGTPLDAAAWCALDTRIGEAFADAVRALDGLDLVVSHGQTVYHWIDGERVRGTMQLGEPSLIAEAAGCPVVSHLRHADIAAGGEGAPLMAVLDRLWLGGSVQSGTVATVNMGGIANIQVITPDGGVRAWDTGPGNALLDAFVSRRSHGHARFDADGALSASGRVHDALLARLLAHPYFSRPAPKTTGRHEFSLSVVDDAIAAVGESLPDADVAATLVEVTAISIADAVRGAGARRVLASGGGVRNPVIMHRLRALLDPVPVSSTAEHGLDPDSRENLMFAVVGVLSWFGVPVEIAGPARRIAGRFTPSPDGLALPAARGGFARLEIRP